jgi:hypothetical protein
MIEEETTISSVIGRNRQANRKAFLAVPTLILFMPFAIGFVWYGVAFAGPSLSVMPAANVVPDVGELTLYILYTGHWPDFDGWVQILIGAGLSQAFAIGIAGALVYLGVVGTATLMGFLTASGIGIAVAGSILAA